LSFGLTLALYTDGLVEAPGIDIDDAIAALADRLAQAPDGDIEDLTETVLGDASHNPRTDDIAILLVRVTRSSATAQLARPPWHSPKIAERVPTQNDARGARSS
jgi:hypothetical protein